MTFDEPPTYSQDDSDLSDEGSQSGGDLQILIVPATNSTGFQKGYLGADLERAAIEGELQVKSADRIQWGKVFVDLVSRYCCQSELM